jgi:hypothetical protein
MSFQELCFWNAGHEPNHLPPGIGLRIPPNADVIVQVHYHPSGKPELDPEEQRNLRHSADILKQTISKVDLD